MTADASVITSASSNTMSARAPASGIGTVERAERRERELRVRGARARGLRTEATVPANRGPLESPGVLVAVEKGQRERVG